MTVKAITAQLNFDCFRALALTLDVQVGGSRLELVSGKDGAPFVTFEASNNKASLACNITGQAIGTTIYPSIEN